MSNKFNLISLGCDKNLVDSEVMLGLLFEAGFVYEQSAGLSDVIIINTCCFIQDALEESINTIIEMGQLKDNCSVKGIIITGCLAERFKDEISSNLPEVDAVLGTTGIYNIVTAVQQVVSNNKFEFFPPIDLPVDEKDSLKRFVSLPSFSSSLKIAEGCDKHCSYCIIPNIRGKYRSRSIESLISEAKLLGRNGVRELSVIAQDISLYGIDIYGENKLCELLIKLCDISDIKWIRLMYCYPENISDELINVIASNTKICNYIDMPIQHINDNILKKMGRNSSSDKIRNTIFKLRSKIPDICIRTSLITGFPGETDSDFNELLEFVSHIEFDNLGVFTYSRENGTKAFDFDNQIDEKVKILRKNKLLSVQRKIAVRKNSKAVGRVFDVLIEGELPDKGMYCGRSFMNAPDIDGVVFVKSDSELMSGDIIPVLVNDYRDYDLIGGVAYEFSK